MHREAEATGQPADRRRPDPLTLIMDLAPQVQKITAACVAAQADAVQNATDRLAAHGRRLAEARDPFSALASHMDPCVSILEVAIAPVRAALSDLPYQQAAHTAVASARRGSPVRESVAHPADSHASRRTSRTADAASTSGGPTPAERRE